MKPAVLMIAYTHYESDPRVIREAEAAVAGGFDVDFLALRRSDSPACEMVRGVRVLRLNQRRYRGSGHVRYLLSYLEFFVRAFFQSAFLFFKRRYRVAHVNNMPDFLVFATLVPWVFGCKVILDIHDPMPNTFASKFKKGERGFFFRILLWQELLSAAYAHQVVTVHHPVKEGVLLKHGLGDDKVEVVANFPDENIFQLRKSFSIDGGLRLAFHGTILERSGLRILMMALAKLKHKDKVFVRIIGEGDFAGELARLITSLGLEKTVEFDNRSYPVHRIPERIADCNVGLVPLEISSITDYALPLKLVEFISMGLPVVAVRNKAILYYLKEEDCLFYQWDDPESLREVLDRAAAQPELLSKFRERSLAVRGRFLWSRERDHYISLLRKLAN